MALPRPRRIWRIVGLIATFLVLFSLTFTSLVMADISSWTKKVDINKLLDKNPRPKDSYANRDLNVLVIGSDHRSKPEKDETGRLVTGMRSDTTLLAHISADRTRVEVISIPRDLMVSRPTCTRENGTTVYGTRSDVQFNSIFALLGGDDDVAAATACTLKTVEEFTGVYIDEFVVVDFDGFEQMVAALGGVTVCIDKPMRDIYGNVNLQPGCHELNPQQALGFARARKGIEDGSDLSRITRQQKLIGAMMKEAQSRNYLTDLPALYSFLRAAMRSMTTSPTFGQASNLGGLALSLGNTNTANIHFYTLPIGAYPADPARVALADEADDMFAALRDDKPIPSSFPYQDLNGNKIEPAAEGSQQCGNSCGVVETPGDANR